MEKKYPTLEENSMKMWLIKYMHIIELELELELILSRWLWERGEIGVASLQKQARVRALCGVVV
jgi:hypothetical protein